MVKKRIMFQVQNNLALKYTLNGENEIASVSFDLNRKSLNIECTCTKGNFCHHTDYIVDFIYNSYFHYEEFDHEDIKVHQCNNKLWLPVSETDMNDNQFIIDVELLYSGGKFHKYCSYCCPGVDTIDNCRHLDYIIRKFTEHYYDLKEQNEEINNIDLDNLFISSESSNSSMDIDN